MSDVHLFAPPRVDVIRRSDGTQLAKSPVPLGSHSRCVGEWLVQWATRTPDVTWLSGHYYDERSLTTQMNPQVLDDALVNALWERSAELVGISRSD